VAAGPSADAPRAAPPGGPVLLFDGLCGLCNRTVRLLLRLDRRGALRFAPLEGDLAAAVKGRHPEVDQVDTLVLVERWGDAAGERALVRSDAVLALARHLGGPWRLAGVLGLVPRVLRDWAYGVIARHRYALFGRLSERPLPPLDMRSRFLS